MTKHDTWVKLTPGSPYEPILNLFPDGMIPMRDPFPLERVTTPDGEQVPLWIVDIQRLSSVQANSLAQLIARDRRSHALRAYRNANTVEVSTEAIEQGGFAMRHGWIASMQCGPEGFQRQKELADFFETAPQPPSIRAWRDFYNSQHDRWIDGDEQPPPINSIEDVDPRLRTPELEEAFKMKQIHNALAGGNYSVFDVLTGRAMVDVLNEIDPDNDYSLVGWDEDEWDDNEIFE